MAARAAARYACEVVFRMRTWPVAALGLGALLLLVALSVTTASRRAQDIQAQLDRLNAHHSEVDAKLRRLRSDVHLSGIFIRDYLLDTDNERAPEYRQQLAAFRRTTTTTLDELGAIARKDGRDDERIASLAEKLDDYWTAFEPLFDWTLVQKILRSARFLRTEVLPRREAVLGIAREIEELNNANLAAQRAEVRRRQVAFRDDLHALLWQSVLFGLVVALVVTVRLKVLEARSEQQRAVTEEAERQMRSLSQQLVATQEEERKNLSRELHDHVGQMLTALRLELGRLERVGTQDGSRVSAAVAECRHLIDEIFHTVRDLSMGLRPSMLDDFGLTPALEWHARDFSTRSGIPVDLSVDGALEMLPDRHRTCVYRVVQEALTNCARHARAHRIAVGVSARDGGLDLFVRDDGVGFEPGRRPDGLGLRGMEERVRELHGTMAISTEPGGGTSILIHIPVEGLVEAAPVAHPAG